VLIVLKPLEWEGDFGVVLEKALGMK